VKIRCLVVGKPRDAEAAALHDRYALRVRRLGASYETVWVPEVRPDGSKELVGRTRLAGDLEAGLHEQPGDTLAEEEGIVREDET
jgi:hypothetical protein